MSDHITEIIVFTFLFLLVSGMGFMAARWRRPTDMAHLDEWGLGGAMMWSLDGDDENASLTRTISAGLWSPWR